MDIRDLNEIFNIEDITDDLIIVLNSFNEIHYWSKSCVNLFQISEARALNQKLVNILGEDLTHEPYYSYFSNTYKYTISADRVITYELRKFLSFKFNNERYMLIVLRDITMQFKVQSFMDIYYDSILSEYSSKPENESSESNEVKDNVNKNMNLRVQKLQEANKKLLKSLEAQGELLNKPYLGDKLDTIDLLIAGLSHEINTPLGIFITANSSVYLSLSELLDKFGYMQSVPTKKYLISELKKMKRCCEISDGSIKSMTSFIDKMRKISLTNYDDTNKKEPINIIVEDFINLIHHEIDNETIDLKVVCKDDFHTYSDYVMELLMCFYRNSLKHGFSKSFPEGKKKVIHILITLKDNCFRITYSDNGIGIEENNVHKVFDPFFSSNWGFNNAGLGLYTVYRMVRKQLNGTIFCKSKKMKYTTFVVDIPLFV